MTNFEKIKQMSVDELAEFITGVRFVYECNAFGKEAQPFMEGLAKNSKKNLQNGLLIAIKSKRNGLKARQTMNKYAVYERIKAEIARTAKSKEEYERRIKALTMRLKI